MKQHLDREKFNYICSQHHEPANLVCVEGECKDRGLICSHCKCYGSKHSLQSLGGILHQIQQDYQAESDTLVLLCGIDNLYEEALTKCARITEAGSQKLMLEAIKQYYHHIKKSISRKKQMAGRIFQPFLTEAAFRQWLLEYQFEEKEQSEKTISNTELNIKHHLVSLKSAVEELEECVKSEESLEKMLMLFTIDYGKRIKYVFSEEQSNKDIILSDGLTAKLQDGYSYRLATVEPPVRKAGGKTFKKSCTFRVGKVTALVGVGLCYVKKIADMNFIFSAYSQHGCYMIVNSGYTYNESDSLFNSQLKNWTFKNEDIITVTLDPKQKSITYKKSDQTFEYTYEEKPEFEMRFAVLLCSAEDTVHIVNS